MTQTASNQGADAPTAQAQPGYLVDPYKDWAEGEGIKLPDLEVRRPSLEDVFLEVTGDNGAEKDR